MIEERVVNGKPVYSYSYAGKKISKKSILEKEKSVGQGLCRPEDV